MFNKNKTAIHFFVLPFLGVISCFCSSTYATSAIQIEVSLTIYNTYSGYITLTTPGFSSGGITYLASSGISLDVHATDNSTREVGGDISSTFTGDGMGVYTDAIIGNVTASDGPKVITGLFLKGTEFIYPTPINIYLDTTAPTMPLGISPFLNEGIPGTDVTFDWSASTDAAAGVKEYRLYISESPTFTSPMVFTSSVTTVIVPNSLFGLTTYYRYVESIDNVGNATVSFPLFFTMLMGPVEGSVNTIPGFLPSTNPPSPTPNPEPAQETPHLEEIPRRRSPSAFTRKVLKPIFEAYTAPVKIGENQQQDFITPSPPSSSSPATEEEYTKGPKYPLISINSPDKPSNSTTQAIKDELEKFKRKKLTSEDIERLKKLLEESKTPIEDYLDEILPHQIGEVIHSSATLSADEVWEELMGVYQQLPTTPFHSEYLQSIVNRPPRIPLLAIILRLLLICYDIETYRQRTFRTVTIKKNKIQSLKTGQINELSL